MSDEWTVVVHEAERVLEVHYPRYPSQAAFDRYDKAIRAAIEKLASKGDWDCLVDQTAVTALAPELAEKIAVLNAWAKAKRMRRTARVIADSAIGELQSVRILKEGGVKNIGQVFKSRDEAWKVLRSPQKNL
ncbi:MAG: hypothetical protein QM723_37480 [Myxococcaceae bacterium]